MPNPHSPQSVTVSQAARLLAERGLAPCSRTSIESAIARRKLRATNPANRVLLIRAEALDEYARNYCRPAAPAGADAA